MKIPEYIRLEDVRKACGELGIRDWTKLKEPRATTREARLILDVVNTEKIPINVEEFRTGLDVELEHGTRFKDANVTNNHPIITGMIVLAHLKESVDYYKLLEVAELEGDLLKAVALGKPAKIKAVYKRLAQAKIALHKAESKRIGNGAPGE
jgi:hypothetical protein